ncbi:MAG: NADPH-dependent FMN reductase [Candidatus Eisenbacteria bacterium]
MRPHVQVILASVREQRAGAHVARWTMELLARREDLAAELVDLRDWPLPNYDQPASPKVLETKYELPLARAWVEQLARADAFVIVTPEYNHSFSGALKNALDWAYAPWNRKPLGLVTYGGPSGGIRCAQSLKLVALELQMIPVRPEVNIPFVGQAFDADGRLTNEVQARRAPQMLDELAWYARVLKAAREAPIVAR